MGEFSIHQFSKKLLQKSIFPHLMAYLRWQTGQVDLPNNKFAPISINLDLITACNFRCTHCLDAEIINTGKMLDLQYLKELIQDWSKKGLKSVILIGGGEPTLYPYFEEVVKFLKGLSLQVGVVSNGTGLKKIENICQLLSKKDWVRLSLDAGTNETFQKIHLPQAKIALDDIMTGVRKIRQKNTGLQIGYSFLIIGDDKEADNIPLVKNIGEIALTARLAKENGFNYLSLKPFISLGKTRGTTISRKNLREIKEEIKKAKKLEDDDFKVIESVNLLCFYDKDLEKTMQKQPRTCHSQFFHSVVTPIGIYSCSLWRGFDNTKIINANQKITKQYYRQFQRNQEKIIDNLNAKELCREASCLYAPLNCWIEDLIKSPEKIKALKSIPDIPDFFL